MCHSDPPEAGKNLLILRNADPFVLDAATQDDVHTFIKNASGQQST